MLKRRINLSKDEYLFLIIIIISASLLRLWDLGSIGFNGDEAVYGGQSATLAGYEQFSKYFSIYRAHPLLLQFIISILFVNFGIADTIARIVPAMLGVSTVILTYFIGKELYDRKVAMVAGILMTIIPYHIIVSRQVLLDVPLSFFFTLTLFFMIRYVKDYKGSHWLYLIGASSGLSFLSKEVGIFALIASIVSLLLTKRFSFKTVLIIVSSFLLASSPYWIPILTIKEAQQTALFYWQWQTSRDQNQPDTFYLTVIFKDALGYILTVLFALSIIYLWKIKKIKEPPILVLLAWIGVTILIFQLLPIKGFHFVISLVPPFVLFGVSFLNGDWTRKVRHYRIILLALIPLVLLTSGPTLNYLFQILSPPLAGSGGIPYVREGAIWIRNNIPDDRILLTLDATTANIIKFYANKEVVSLHSNRNPAYTEIGNPDLYILNGQIHYLVSQPNIADSYPHLRDEVEELNKLVIKHSGVPIHIENQTYTGKNGEILIKPALIIYSLDGIQEE